MALNIHVNTGTSDAELNASGTEFTQFSSGNDKLIFTAGNTAVQDAADIPTEQELISSGVQLTGVEIVVDGYFMQDTDADELKEISLMGNTTNRYVLAFDFDASTASEPVLEVWDDSDLDSIDATMLGAGTASSSFIRGITTTYSAPSTNWTGSRLAGSASGNFLYLNDQNGALTSADTLYANLKIIVPSSQTSGFSNTPVFVVKWLDN